MRAPPASAANRGASVRADGRAGIVIVAIGRAPATNWGRPARRWNASVNSLERRDKRLRDRSATVKTEMSCSDRGIRCATRYAWSWHRLLGQRTTVDEGMQLTRAIDARRRRDPCRQSNRRTLWISAARAGMRDERPEGGDGLSGRRAELRVSPGRYQLSHGSAGIGGRYQTGADEHRVRAGRRVFDPDRVAHGRRIPRSSRRRSWQSRCGFSSKRDRSTRKVRKSRALTPITRAPASRAREASSSV